MRENVHTSIKEINFFILSAMLFAVCEALSIEFNDYFRDLDIFGIHFSLNFSVVYFCFSFFIIDLVTELYNNRIADFFIYSKIISQGLFILFGYIGVHVTGILQGDIAKSFTVAPRVLLCSIIASVLSYKLTGWMMQYSKVKFRGRFLFSRYLFSTFPGEVLFSLIFTLLHFSSGRIISQIFTVFVDLIVVKFILSIIFSLMIVPITGLLRHYLDKKPEDAFESLPLEPTT